MGVDNYDDLYWLRKIRDANPTSQLPSLWLDSEDPYTQWEGVTWREYRVYALDVATQNITTLANVNKLTYLKYLYCYDNYIVSIDLAGLNYLKYLNCDGNLLIFLDLTGLNSLLHLYCAGNSLTSIPTLTSKGLIINYNFIYNNFPTAELDRFMAMGFTDESKLLPQNP